MSKELSIKKLETLAVDALEDIKGRDIIIVNTTKVSQMFERIVLASGDSNRQVRALARHNARSSLFRQNDQIPCSAGQGLGISVRYQEPEPRTSLLCLRPMAFACNQSA